MSQSPVVWWYSEVNCVINYHLVTTQHSRKHVYGLRGKKNNHTQFCG
jgi:hypothetical protein